MTLYYVILAQERKETEEAYQTLVERTPALLFAMKTRGNRIVDIDVAKSKELLNAAYRLQDSKLSEQELAFLVKELEKINDSLYGCQSIEPKVLAAKTDWVKACVEFYQQLIQQEKTATTYEDAVKAQFGSAAAFRTALQPIAEAERKLYTMLKEEALLETVNGTAEAENELYAPLKRIVALEVAGALDASLKVLDDVRESAIQRVFPK